MHQRGEEASSGGKWGAGAMGAPVTKQRQRRWEGPCARRAHAVHMPWACRAHNIRLPMLGQGEGGEGGGRGQQMHSILSIASIYQRINVSIYQHINISMYPNINLSTYQRINTCAHCWLAPRMPRMTAFSCTTVRAKLPPAPRPFPLPPGEVGRRNARPGGRLAEGLPGALGGEAEQRASRMAGRRGERGVLMSLPVGIERRVMCTSGYRMRL